MSKAVGHNDVELLEGQLLLEVFCKIIELLPVLASMSIEIIDSRGHDDCAACAYLRSALEKAARLQFPAGGVK